MRSWDRVSVPNVPWLIVWLHEPSAQDAMTSVTTPELGWALNERYALSLVQLEMDPLPILALHDPSGQTE